MQHTTIDLSVLSTYQLDIYNSLVRLGDSKELAFKTAIEVKEPTKETKKFYRCAYTN